VWFYFFCFLYSETETPVNWRWRNVQFIPGRPMVYSPESNPGIHASVEWPLPSNFLTDELIRRRFHWTRCEARLGTCAKHCLGCIPPLYSKKRHVMGLSRQAAKCDVLGSSHVFTLIRLLLFTPVTILSYVHSQSTTAFFAARCYAMLCRGCLSVCLSIWAIVTLRYSVKTTEQISSIFPHMQTFLVNWIPNFDVVTTLERHT